MIFFFYLQPIISLLFAIFVLAFFAKISGFTFLLQEIKYRSLIKWMMLAFVLISFLAMRILFIE